MAAFDVCSSKTKPACRPGFEILCMPSIRYYQKAALEKISTILLISEDDSFSLLKRYKWCGDHVFQGWFDGSDADPSMYRRSIDVDKIDKFVCGICFEPCPIRNAAPTLCGHHYCTDCMKANISILLRDGLRVLDAVCPTEGCRRTLGSSLISKLACEQEVAKFNKFATRSYVDDNFNIRWCPGVDCKYAIAGKEDQKCTDVECFKFHGFCWLCLGDSHYPLDCKRVKSWLRCAQPWSTTDWKVDNLKLCPSCKNPIHLDGGCQHMTCACRYQFCWVCISPWDPFHAGSDACIPKRSSFSSEEPEDNLEAIPPSKEETYYRRTFHRRDRALQRAVRVSRSLYLGYSVPLKRAWFEIRKSLSISKWICAMAHIHKLDVTLFDEIKEDAESKLIILISCASDLKATTRTEKKRERDVWINGCTKNTRERYERLVARMQWEASWQESNSVN